jgi:hypothetical protein
MFKNLIEKQKKIFGKTFFISFGVYLVAIFLIAFFSAIYQQNTLSEKQKDVEVVKVKQISLNDLNNYTIQKKKILINS